MTLRQAAVGESCYLQTTKEQPMSYILKYTLEGKRYETLFLSRKRADDAAGQLVAKGVRVVISPFLTQTVTLPAQFRLS